MFGKQVLKTIFVIVTKLFVSINVLCLLLSLIRTGHMFLIIGHKLSIFVLQFLHSKHNFWDFKAIIWIKLGCGCYNTPHSHPCLGLYQAEYSAPVWCRSAHTRLIKKLINDALRIVTGCLRPTPTDNLFI